MKKILLFGMLAAFLLMPMVASAEVVQHSTVPTFCSVDFQIDQAQSTSFEKGTMVVHDATASIPSEFVIEAVYSPPGNAEQSNMLMISNVDKTAIASDQSLVDKGVYSRFGVRLSPDTLATNI